MSKLEGLFADSPNPWNRLRWHQLRAEGITATDVPKILWDSENDLVALYAKKQRALLRAREITQRQIREPERLHQVINQELEADSNFPMQWGRSHEAQAANEFGKEFLLSNWRMDPGALWEAPNPYHFIKATTDREIMDTSRATFGTDPQLFPVRKALLEIKCPLHHAGFEVPANYWWQMQFQMFCTGASFEEIFFCSIKFPWSKAPAQERLIARVPYSEWAVQQVLPVLAYWNSMCDLSDSQGEPFEGTPIQWFLSCRASHPFCDPTNLPEDFYRWEMGKVSSRARPIGFSNFAKIQEWEPGKEKQIEILRSLDQDDPERAKEVRAKLAEKKKK